MEKPPYVVGLIWDHMTPQVEGKIIQDLIAIQNQPQGRNLAVWYEDGDPSFRKMLQTMGIRRTPAKTLATLWILYQTGVHELKAPEHARNVVERDLRQRIQETKLDTAPKPGFYLAPQGRNIAPTLDINRPMPGWYPGGPSPLVVWTWG
jgi:hypothetical protein